MLNFWKNGVLTFHKYSFFCYRNYIDKEIKRIEGKLGNAGFLAKAPAEVVAKEKTKSEEIKWQSEQQPEKRQPNCDFIHGWKHSSSEKNLK